MVYLPAHFEDHDLAGMHALIGARPLATLVTSGPDGIAANHIPLLLDLARGEHGTLIGHVARANDLWREGFHVGESLAIFHGPDAYISPNWYPTKQETHEVVPTWNYAVVHAYGELVVHDDPKWVRGVVGRLTKAMESTQPVPWKMADAPPAFTAAMLVNIVGIELPITRLVGKMKASQNRSEADRNGVIDALQESDSAGSREMARLVHDAGEQG